ncbi:BON domain-containing protein [Parahaliea mediterranea]|uniref:BON domain-containing protein n=1 Tax=Parahaliea mediterranea TaxID=651086 RepID=A0A939DC60_9GAMM|nr:BON domain-containing protein [Parahaliea mediterranea]MBN7795364.1 BON domain-containing protein [Parahaliea mediterranea]
MTRLFLLPLIFSGLLLGGCGSMLANLEANPIEDEPVERTMGRRLEDESVEIKAMVNIRAADDRFDDAHLTIVSYNGFVLLAGQVASEELKARAANVVRDIRGVRRIYNELQVSAPSSGMTRTSDAWITTKVKSWLLANSSTPGMRVKVVTENGVVYLMGLATQSEAERVTEVAASLSGVQRVVRLFEIVSV